MNNFELRDYQKALALEIIRRKRLMVVAPMGSGKTLSSLIAVATLVSRECVKRILVIAPKRVATSVWPQEVEDFDLPVNLRFCYRALDTKLFLLEPHTHHICVCSVTMIEEIPRGCWDMVIIDESTLFGNYSSIRSREARRICKKVPRLVLLTGTPIHGGYEKLWHQMFLLDAGAAIGKTLTSFRTTFMQLAYSATGAYSKYEMNPWKVPHLHGLIKPLVFVVSANIKLPPCFTKEVRIDLPPKRRAEYDKFEKESIVHFQSETGFDAYESPRTLVAFASSARGMKLRQLASGLVYTDMEKKDYSITHRQKIEALKEIREEYEGGIMVVYNFVSELRELEKVFPAVRRLQTKEDIAAWNAQKVDMILVHPASVGHGLNLQKGGHVVVWFSLTYDAELFAQTNKRLHRPGQTEPVSIISIIAKRTIDHKILSVLKLKERNAKAFERI